MSKKSGFDITSNNEKLHYHTYHINICNIIISMYYVHAYLVDLAKLKGINMYLQFNKTFSGAIRAYRYQCDILCAFNMN